MKMILLLSCIVLIVVFSLPSCVSSAGESFLSQEYDLVGKRSAETQYYHMERVIVVRASGRHTAACGEIQSAINGRA